MSFISNLAGLDAVDKKDIEAIDNGGLTSQTGPLTLNYYIDMDTFRRISIYYDIGGTGPITMTLEASNDEVASGSANYLDVTSDVLGSASFTADAFVESQIPIVCKWLKIKVVIGGVASDNAVNLVARKGY